MTPASVYLARHGQTAYNLERRFQGHLPVALDDTGREQAHDLAERASVPGFAALWCSPLLRARETADIVGARIGLEPREDPRLMETDAGDWTNRLFVDVQAEDPDGFAGFINGDPEFAFPGGESFAQQGARVATGLADIERGALPALVVCHGVVIRIALYQRAGRKVALAERVPNAALVPLDPDEAEHTELGGGAALPPELIKAQMPSAPGTVPSATHNRGVLDAAISAPPIADLLAVLGSAGTVVGGGIGWIVGTPKWRKAFENLALGAAAGGVCGCLVAFLAYSVLQVFG